MVGAPLSVAGVLFHGLLRNPLADPHVIGTSGGAAFGASLGAVLFSHFSILGFGTIPALAFLGAMGTMVLVFRISRVGGRTPLVTLLLVGFAVRVMLGYTVSLLLIVNQRFEFNTRIIYAWLLGGIWIEHWSQLALIALIVAVGTAGALLLSRSLNALALGEECAEHLGIAVERQKAAVIVIGSLLTAAAVSAGGLIGFVGLIVPHFLRLLFGPNHSRLLPLAALGGAAFLVTTDLLARVVMPPNELPVGILTALVGGPAFLLLLRRAKREYRVLSVALIHVSQACFDYGGPPVLSGVFLDICAGERIAVLGPNGAGKTTLLKLLSGAQSPSKGSILLEGRVLHAVPRAEVARKIAVVAQDLAVPFAFTAREIVELGRTPHVGLLRGFSDGGPGRRPAGDAVDAYPPPRWPHHPRAESSSSRTSGSWASARYHPAD